MQHPLYVAQDCDGSLATQHSIRGLIGEKGATRSGMTSRSSDSEEGEEIAQQQPPLLLDRHDKRSQKQDLHFSIFLYSLSQKGGLQIFKSGVHIYIYSQSILSCSKGQEEFLSVLKFQRSPPSSLLDIQ